MSSAPDSLPIPVTCKKVKRAKKTTTTIHEPEPSIRVQTAEPESSIGVQTAEPEPSISVQTAEPEPSISVQTAEPESSIGVQIAEPEHSIEKVDVVPIRASHILMVEGEEYDELVAEYLESLDEMQIKAIRIAHDHLKTSFSIVNSNGYADFLKQKVRR